MMLPRLGVSTSRFPSISDLAARFHVDHSYVARTLRLARLAPDIVEVILTGDEPDAVTLNRLMRPWPGLWERQRAEVGETRSRIPEQQLAAGT